MRNNVKAGIAGAAVTASSMAAAAGGGTTIDFSGVLAGIVAGGIISAIVAAAAVKAGPNFAKWGANKLANFFGR